jgi:hypothetical protein
MCLHISISTPSAHRHSYSYGRKLLGKVLPCGILHPSQRLQIIFNDERCALTLNVVKQGFLQFRSLRSWVVNERERLTLMNTVNEGANRTPDRTETQYGVSMIQGTLLKNLLCWDKQNRFGIIANASGLCPTAPHRDHIRDQALSTIQSCKSEITQDEKNRITMRC